VTRLVESLIGISRGPFLALPVTLVAAGAAAADPVPVPTLGGNVARNLLTNVPMAAGLLLATL